MTLVFGVDRSDTPPDGTIQGDPAPSSTAPHSTSRKLVFDELRIGTSNVGDDPRQLTLKATQGLLDHCLSMNRDPARLEQIAYLMALKVHKICTALTGHVQDRRGGVHLEQKREEQLKEEHEGGRKRRFRGVILHHAPSLCGGPPISTGLESMLTTLEAVRAWYDGSVNIRDEGKLILPVDMRRSNTFVDLSPFQAKFRDTIQAAASVTMSIRHLGRTASGRDQFSISFIELDGQKHTHQTIFSADCCTNFVTANRFRVLKAAVSIAAIHQLGSYLGENFEEQSNPFLNLDPSQIQLLFQGWPESTITDEQVRHSMVQLGERFNAVVHDLWRHLKDVIRRYYPNVQVSILESFLGGSLSNRWLGSGGMNSHFAGSIVAFDPSFKLGLNVNPQFVSYKNVADPPCVGEMVYKLLDFFKGAHIGLAASGFTCAAVDRPDFFSVALEARGEQFVRFSKIYRYSLNGKLPLHQIPSSLTSLTDMDLSHVPLSDERKHVTRLSGEAVCFLMLGELLTSEMAGARNLIHARMCSDDKLTLGGRMDNVRKFLRQFGTLETA